MLVVCTKTFHSFESKEIRRHSLFEKAYRKPEMMFPYRTASSCIAGVQGG